MIQATEALGREVGVALACEAVGVARSSLYAARHPHLRSAECVTLPPANALSSAERTEIWDSLTEPRFADQTPYEIVPQLLDEGRYLGSIRSFYRVLAENQAIPERRAVLRHPPRSAPRLSATRPLQVWTWDITQLACVLRGVVLYLYLVLDLYSRYIIGWLIAERQSTTLAEHLLTECYHRWEIAPDQLTIHNDNGGPMIAQPLTDLWLRLGVESSRSRPHVSNDTLRAFSEAAFKTLKYHCTFPERFADQAQSVISRSVRAFERWYNWRHAHIGLGLMTPLPSTSASPSTSGPSARPSSTPLIRFIPSASPMADLIHLAGQSRYASTPCQPCCYQEVCLSMLANCSSCVQNP